MIKRLIPWGLLLLAGMFLFSIFSGKNDPNDSPSGVQGDRISRPSTRERAIRPPDTVPLGIPPSAVTRKVLETTVGKLGSSAGPEDSLRIISNLKESIASSADGQAAAAAIAEFLESGQDASTGLSFSVGSEGVLQLSPSLRIALLDLLPSLDPNLALSVAREIMDGTDSADEYAVCLRNLAWNDFEGDLRAELSNRFERMIKTDVWVNEPTAGFLEAMDAAVEISDLRQFRNLTRIVAGRDSETDPDLSRAVGIALDRMVLRNPGLLVESFGADPLLNDLPPILRASLLSRLDITKADEREVFVSYLQAGNHGEGELEYFGDLFPNGNYIQGHRLITKDEPSLSIEARMAEDLKVVEELENLGPNLPATAVRIRERLSGATLEKASKAEETD